jgi:hypothetical protein
MDAIISFDLPGAPSEARHRFNLALTDLDFEKLDTDTVWVKKYAPADNEAVTAKVRVDFQEPRTEPSSPSSALMCRSPRRRSC